MTEIHVYDRVEFEHPDTGEIETGRVEGVAETFLAVSMAGDGSDSSIHVPRKNVRSVNK